MTTEIEDILQRDKTLRSHREPWESHWQELAEIFLPRRADFTFGHTEGAKRTENIFDSTPMQARRSLSASIDGLIKPKTGKWFSIAARDKELAEDEEVKRWVEDSEDALYREIYDPLARFIQRTGEVDDELVTFGTAYLFIGESRDLGRFSFRSIPLRMASIAENSDGNVDTIYITHDLTARQAEQRFGDAIGEKTKEALTTSNKRPDKIFPFLQAIQPRSERDGNKRDNLNLPFANIIIDVKSEHKVLESGFHEFPVATPRWDTATDESYGRSPAMLSLGDAQTLQAQAETLLRAGQKGVDPPLLVGDDSVLGDLLSYPGGITHFDMEAAKDLGQIPIQPLNTGANIPLGREMQNDSRDLVWSAFFRNVLQLPVDTPSMTATEVLERKEEFVRTIGPVFGRLETDYITVIVERGFNIMLRGGGFGPPPEILVNRDVDFRFASPVAKARKQMEAAGAARAMELLAPFIQFDPTLTDNFNGDEIARDTPEIFGMPKRWIRAQDEVDGMRGQRAEAEAAATQAEQAGQVADIAKTGTEAIQNIQEAPA